jgi:hypothetical protein
MEDYEVYLPTIQSCTADYVIELLAQLHPSGRVLDNFRIALGGSTAVNNGLDGVQMIPDSTFKGHKLAFHLWSRDILI